MYATEADVIVPLLLVNLESSILTIKFENLIVS